ARALIHSPKLLILDEPTAGIDINLRKLTYDFLQKLNKNGLTILLTTHYLEEVEKLCNTLAVIKNGEIIINTSKKEFFEKIKNSIFEIILDKNYSNFDFLKKYNFEINNNILKISISKQKNLNDIFELLNKNNIGYKNVTNCTNELETLFESLTK
ncbi:MAG: ABC transporter ATP-binding protein, partial [Candidatus Gracilibacteria bacterium]|nr:ABC transporter ATP-binding protein [Candidatus Gracilibacteria bacterium]